jgi:methionyl-tRNA formyltransferase
MRVIFMATAPFAEPTLRGLFASSHDVLAVVTQPDRPRGRGRKPSPSPIKTLAMAHDCAVLQPASLRRDAVVVEQMSSLRPEAIVVVAYGNILPLSVLEIPLHGCINVHASLLPKYRGAAPINWALMRGEAVTGCTVIQMDEHVDTGDIWWHDACDITADDDALSLGTRLADLGAAGLLEVLAAIEQGTLAPRPQSEDGVSYAPKLTKELSPIAWQQPAAVVHNRIRGLVPWPGATARFGDLDVKLWRTAVHDEPHAEAPGTVTAVTPEGVLVACGTDQLFIHELQPANRRRMPASDFAQGYRVQQGQRFA